MRETRMCKGSMLIRRRVKYVSDIFSIWGEIFGIYKPKVICPRPRQSALQFVPLLQNPTATIILPNLVGTGPVAKHSTSSTG
jgi:hypothetical protein